MKKIIFIYAITCICAATITHEASCQDFTNSAVLNTHGTDTGAPGYNSALPENTANNYRNTINIKAVRNFIKHFNKAKDVTWQKVQGRCYIAEFMSDSIQTRVVYNQNGSWNYTLRKYAENKMRKDVRAMVKSIFFDYSIMEINEIKLLRQTEDTIYSILIKDGDNYKILQICNKEMEIVSDFTKP